MPTTLHQWDFENHEFKKGVHGRREKNEQLEEAEKKILKIYQEHFDEKPFKPPYTNPFGYEFARLKKRKIGKTNPNRIKDLSQSQPLQLVQYTPVSKKGEEYLDIW